MTSRSFFRVLAQDHLRFLWRFYLIGLTLLSLSRLALMLWQWERTQEAGNLWLLLIQGVRADIIMLSLWAIIPILAMPLFPPKYTQKLWQKLTQGWAVIGLILLVFLEVATPSFILQYDVRPNRLFVEYLKYPQEVFSMLWHGFRGIVLGGIVITLILGAAIMYGMRSRPHSHYSLHYGYLLITWPLLVLVLAMGIRSTTQHRPANPALFAITGDALVNSLVISSAYSVAFCIYNLKHEAKSSEIYGTMKSAEVLQHNLSWPWLTGYAFNNTKLPTLHHQQAQHQRERPLNLVIVLEESLGATFVQSLGGLPVTPELEKLKAEGWWFEQIYATGTRSVRGIEAVVAGFMPTPAQSTVKLSLSQKNFFTIASILQQQGYATEFIYGGEAHFDNMRSFFTGNGFSTIIDINNMKSPEFVGSWGASDEDLFNHAHQHLLEISQQQQPFFSLIFTSSNHEPFEFPDGKIDLYEQPKSTVNNAVKYADYALGRFFEKAKTSPYWHNTLFLVVADHDNRVYGDNLVPVHKFHIPGLILGADIQPERIKPIASQIDLAPTLLSLLGVSGEHPMLGRDFSRDRTTPGRALIQFEDYFALMEEQDSNSHSLTILKPDASSLAATYHIQAQDVELHQAATPTAQQKALAHVLLPSLLYRQQQYRLPEDTNLPAKPAPLGKEARQQLTQDTH